MSTWTESGFLLSLSHTQPQEEKNPNYCQTPRSVSREEGKGERLGRTPLVLACPNHGFSALEGRSRSSGPIYRQGSREQCHELVMELRERFSPNARSCALKAAALIWLAQNTQSAGFLMHCALLLSPILLMPQVSALGATVAFSKTAGHWQGSSCYMLI